MPVTGACFANKDDLVLKGNNLIALSLCVELYVFMVELVYVLAHIKILGKYIRERTMHCKEKQCIVRRAARKRWRILRQQH